MKPKGYLPLSLLLGIMLFSAGFSAQRVVVCEEFYAEY